MIKEKKANRKDVVSQSVSGFDYEGISKEYYLIPRHQPAPGDLQEKSSESGAKEACFNNRNVSSYEAAFALFDSFIEELLLDDALEPDLLFDLKYLIKDYIGKVYSTNFENVYEDLFPDDIFEEDDY